MDGVAALESYRHLLIRGYKPPPLPESGRAYF